MSTTETPAASVAATGKRSGWRRFFVGSALVAAGVIIGIGTTALSQGGPRGGYGDGPGRYWGEQYDGQRGMGPGGMGPRGWSNRDDDGDGPRGWGGMGRGMMGGWFSRNQDGDGPRGWGGMGRGGMHGWHQGGGPFGGGAFLTPGRIERMVDRLAWAVDASSEQKQKLAAIAQRTADDVKGPRRPDGRSRQARSVARRTPEACGRCLAQSDHGARRCRGGVDAGAARRSRPPHGALVQLAAWVT